MKFTALRENIQKVLTIIQRVVVKNPSLPILENVLLEIDGKRLKISATNLELGIHAWVKGKVEEGGRVSVSVQLLGGVIGNLREERVTLVGKGLDLALTTQAFDALVKGQDANDFPLIPNPEVKNEVDLSKNDIVSGMSQVNHIAVVSDIYPEISGVFFSFSKEKLTLVATDSFRLGKKEVSLRVPKEFVGSEFILPLRVAQELSYILEQQNDATVTLGLNENQVIFRLGDVYIVSRLLAGSYPNYNDLVPKDFLMDVVINRKEFIEKIKLISVFSPKTNDCKVEIRKGELSLSSEATVGSSRVTLKATIRGKGVGVITFNYRYLLDGLLCISTKDVVLHIKNESSPIVLQGVQDQSYLYLVAPLKG